MEEGLCLQEIGRSLYTIVFIHMNMYHLVFKMFRPFEPDIYHYPSCHLDCLYKLILIAVTSIII